MPAGRPPEKHILVLSNAARTLIRFRGKLIRGLIERGHRVTAASAEPEEAVAQTLASWGATYEPVALGRTTMNPASDIGAVAALYRLMRRVRPDVLFAYTIKPVVYGLIAARAASVPRRVAMITGLGYAFTEGLERKRKLARTVASTGYWLSLRLADRVIFQNADDCAYFVDRGMARLEHTAVVAGSGVDLAHYTPAPLPDGPITFLMIARLLADKGVREFTAAARMVKRLQPEARFVLVGKLDSNPAAVAAEELAAWQREGLIEWQGPLADVRPSLAACHVYVLPSYREGMPRTVLEALATGRAIVTTNVAGCRETVVPGKNGLLVPMRDPETLAQALLRLCHDRVFVATAGQESLALARTRFDVNKVNAAIFEVLEGGSASEAGTRVVAPGPPRGA